MGRRLAASLLLALFLCPLAHAQVDTVTAEQRQQLEALQKKARENREAAAGLRRQENAVVRQLNRTDRDLTATRRRLRDLKTRARRLDFQLDATRLDLDRNLTRLSDQRAALRQRLRSMYKFGPARELEFLLSTESFAQLLARWDYLVLVAEQARRLLEGVRERKDVVETLEHRLEGHREQVNRTTRQTTGENKRLAVMRASRQQTLSSIQTQRQAFEAAAAQLERDAQALKRLIARLEAKRAAAPVPYTGDFARGHGQLDWPARGQVVGHFGLETNPRFPNVKVPNNGVDIGVPVGTAVKAVAKGRVDYTSDNYASYGQIVILNHGDSYYTLYAHLSDIAVSVGQEVTAGQTIGRSGETGSLKGPILHFEVRKGSTALDPEDWLQ
jgi:septal ring factor EnvC (AmiA/AmiB activator)